MTERTLRDCRILVVEDEYMLAEDLRLELGESDAVVIGPVSTVDDATALILSQPHIDGAILDVNLRGDMIFPVADLLGQRRIPYLFTTGYDASVIPPRFEQVVRCEKPINMKLTMHALGRAVHVDRVAG